MQKQTLALWYQGVQQFKREDIASALDTFQRVGKLSKVLFNLGMIYLGIEDYSSAEKIFSEGILQDQYFAVCYFQKAHALFMLAKYDLADGCLRYCYKLLLDNDFIDYTQLHLKYKLYRFEVLYNMAVCNELIGNYNVADKLFSKADACPRTLEHKTAIENAKEVKPADMILFTVPLSEIFEVSEMKTKNMGKKDYLQDARLVLQEKRLSNKNPNSLSPPDNIGEFHGFSGVLLMNPRILGGKTLIGKDDIKTIPRVQRERVQKGNPNLSAHVRHNSDGTEAAAKSREQVPHNISTHVRTNSDGSEYRPADSFLKSNPGMKRNSSLNAAVRKASPEDRLPKPFIRDGERRPFIRDQRKISLRKAPLTPASSVKSPDAPFGGPEQIPLDDYSRRKDTQGSLPSGRNPSIENLAPTSISPGAARKLSSERKPYRRPSSDSPAGPLRMDRRPSLDSRVDLSRTDRRPSTELSPAYPGRMDRITSTELSPAYSGPRPSTELSPAYTGRMDRRPSIELLSPGYLRPERSPSGDRRPSDRYVDSRGNPCEVIKLDNKDYSNEGLLTRPPSGASSGQNGVQSRLYAGSPENEISSYYSEETGLYDSKIGEKSPPLSPNIRNQQYKGARSGVSYLINGYLAPADNGRASPGGYQPKLLPPPENPRYCLPTDREFLAPADAGRASPGGYQPKLLGSPENPRYCLPSDRVRIKLHTSAMTRAMNIDHHIHIDDFFAEVCRKLNFKERPNNLCYVDQDDGNQALVNILDQEDLEMAFGTLMPNQKVLHLYFEER